MADSFILMVLALVVFGPRRLPQIGRQIGKLMYEFRKASNDFKFQMEEELRAAEDSERRLKEEAERHRVAALAAESQASVSAPAQTVESAADIGAVEPATASAYPEQYPAEGTVPNAELAGASEPAADAALADAAPADAVPVIQPPQTGEQVSASRPEYFYEPPAAPAEPAAVAELNPEASAEANADSAIAETDPASHPNSAQRPNSVPASENASSTPPKETVSQHG
jgi:sec-independent protein translocase protein TatB